MTSLDYTPTLDGEPYDPAPAGGSVGPLALFTSPARSGEPFLTVTTPSALGDAVYRFEIPEPPPGRYWLSITWSKDGGSEPYIDRSEHIDLPILPGRVCSPEDVALKLKVALPLSDEQRETLEVAIEDAQADVEGYLNRPLAEPRHEVAQRRYPVFGAQDLRDYRSWPGLIDLYDDRVKVESWTDNGDGSYDVKVLVGLDGAAERPIVRYVVAHAAESVRTDPSSGMGKRRVTSVSAEGQSVSYEKGAAAEGSAGALPTLKSLARYRRLSAFSRPSGATPPWPYRGGFRGPVGWV